MVEQITATPIAKTGALPAMAGRLEKTTERSGFATTDEKN
jgi:hypothetical protein